MMQLLQYNRWVLFMRERRSVLTSVFYVWIITAGCLILRCAFILGNVEIVLRIVYDCISNKLGWVYMLAMTAFVVFAIYLIFSPYGKIRLGRQDEKPQYSYFTWFSFLFTAGMGVGLVFYGVNEPVTHFHNPPS